MITRTLTQTGWLITDSDNEKVLAAGTNSNPGMTASEKELSKKMLHTQAEILLVKEKLEQIETFVEAGLIANRVSSINKATGK